MNIEKLKLLNGLREIYKFTDPRHQSHQHVVIDGEHQKIEAVSYAGYAEIFLPIKSCAHPIGTQNGTAMVFEKFDLDTIMAYVYYAFMTISILVLMGWCSYLTWFRG